MLCFYEIKEKKGRGMSSKQRWYFNFELQVKMMVKKSCKRLEENAKIVKVLSTALIIE